MFLLRDGSFTQLHYFFDCSSEVLDLLPYYAEVGNSVWMNCNGRMAMKRGGTLRYFLDLFQNVLANSTMCSSLLYSTYVIAWWGTLPTYCFYMCFTISIAHLTVTSSLWLRPSSFLFVIPLYWGGATSSQINSLGSIHVCHLMWHIASLYLPSEPHIYSFHLLTHSYLVGRSMVVWYIPMIHTCSLMCTNHIDMTAHSSLSYWVRYHSYTYAAQLGIVMYLTLEQCW